MATLDGFVAGEVGDCLAAEEPIAMGLVAFTQCRSRGALLHPSGGGDVFAGVFALSDVWPRFASPKKAYVVPTCDLSRPWSSHIRTNSQRPLLGFRGTYEALGAVRTELRKLA